jgi:2-phospho-L-lactate transferase/gluconeogenesis factor (CofD/UPF0052 family)
MTFEERIEALTRRHEALAESLELVGYRLDQQERLMAEQNRANELLFAQIALRFADTRDAIDRIARIAGVHQDRIDGHEQRLDSLEH